MKKDSDTLKHNLNKKGAKKLLYFMRRAGLALPCAFL